MSSFSHDVDVFNEESESSFSVVLGDSPFSSCDSVSSLDSVLLSSEESVTPSSDDSEDD